VQGPAGCYVTPVHMVMEPSVCAMHGPRRGGRPSLYMVVGRRLHCIAAHHIVIIDGRCWCQDSHRGGLDTTVCHAPQRAARTAATHRHRDPERSKAGTVDGRLAGAGASPLFSSQIQHPNFTMQKEDSPSHQNVGTCMEY
jgi:hypothetical protein